MDLGSLARRVGSSANVLKVGILDETDGLVVDGCVDNCGQDRVGGRHKGTDSLGFNYYGEGGELKDWGERAELG